MEGKGKFDILRRKLVALLGVLTAAVGTFVLRKKLAAQESEEKRQPTEQTQENQNGRSHRWGMVIDLDKCTGCGACVVACSVENNMMLGDAKLAEQGRVIRWMYLLPMTEGEYPNIKSRLLPMLCQHCDRPPCVFVCPVSATYEAMHRLSLLCQQLPLHHQVFQLGRSRIPATHPQGFQSRCSRSLQRHR
jgi:ferredoxin